MKTPQQPFTQGESTMSYTHLSIIEHSKLEILHQQGKSSRAITKELGRHPSTICRELERTASSEAYEQNKPKMLIRNVVKIAFGVAISQYPTGTFLTATADRGKEFACYANL
jgi:IS30 family transposase